MKMSHPPPKSIKHLIFQIRGITGMPRWYGISGRSDSVRLMEFLARAKCRVKAEFRRVFRLNVNAGQFIELAPKIEPKTHVRGRMYLIIALYMPLYLVQLEK